MFNLSMMSGTVYSIQRNMKLQAEFAQRRSNGFKKQEQTSDPQKDSMLKQLRELQEQNESVNKNNAISTIQSKLESGKKLSPSELAYLKENAPDLYEQAVKVEKDREQYKRELKTCKTKDDVNRLHNQKMLSAASELATIKDNPNISDEKKLEYCRFINAKVNSAAVVYDDFTSSERYKKMPTESEKAAEAEENNDSKAEEIITDDKKTDTDKTDLSDDDETNVENEEKPVVEMAETETKDSTDYSDKASERKSLPESDNLLMRYPFLLEQNEKMNGKRLSVTI